MANSAPNVLPFSRPRTNDPQVTVTGTLKEGSTCDYIVFTVQLGLFELTCIANVPLEGQTTAPVYVKHKIRQPRRDEEG